MATRQKSCIICFRAKRKCDLGIPECSRCRVKNIHCQYKATKSIVESQTRPCPLVTNGNSKTTFIDGEDLLHGAYNLTSSSNFDMHLGEFDGLHSSYERGIPLADFQMALDHTSTVELLPDAFEYCGSQIRSYPEQFARYGSTPFIHRRLYEENIPAAIRHAFSTCAMWLGKSSSNRDMTYRTIDAEVTELFQTDVWQWSLEDAVAHVQALILYQIIRFFDGDVRQRAFAEQQDHILATWTETLYSHLTLQTPLFSPSNIAVDYDWRSWILVESARRTVLMSLFLRGFYHALKTGFCNTIAAMTDLPISTRAVLWELDSSARWQLALKAAEPELIPYKDFTPKWAEGELARGDVGDYERLLIIACKGKNEFEQVCLAKKTDSDIVPSLVPGLA